MLFADRLTRMRLIAMVFESARMNTLHRIFEDNWNKYKVHILTTKPHMGNIWSWEYLSADLLDWKGRSRTDS